MTAASGTPNLVLMEEILTNWAGLIGYFVLTGGLYEATKRTIRAKAGDPGFKGFFYVWGQYLLMPIGGALGAGGHELGIPMHDAFGGEMGGAILAGVIAAAFASHIYSMVVGGVKSKVQHKLAKEAK